MLEHLGKLGSLGAALLVTSMACSGGEDSSQDGSGGNAGSSINLDSNSGDSSSDSGGTGSGAASGSSGSTVDPTMSCSPMADDSGCVGVSFEGESIPLDIYVMFDLSCSMSCSVDRSGCCRDSDDPDPLEDWRIQPVREAMKSFLRDNMSAGIGVGLGFFGDHDLSQSGDPNVCSVASHSDATVDIQLLPGAADTLIQELDAGEPQGGTPTHLAIEGACNYAGSWKAQQPGHKVVVLLVTDGIPEHSCNADIGKARTAAEDCYDNGDGFETYVLGVVANNNNSLDQLHSIAEAGGTDQAYLTDTDDVAGSVLAALNAIRADAAIPCDLQIPSPPDGQSLDARKVNLGICDAAGDVVATPYVETQDDCGDSPGWYYNDPGSPESIHLCNVTCETVSVPGSSLFFSLGCDTWSGEIK